MKEGEILFRKIVNDPRDDTARLVYADWLQEHDDPRGAEYLRAEAEWAMPWSSGERPVDSPILRDHAEGLDPVWVARVSRPPIGVCCTHLRLEGGERSPTIADIQAVEQELNLTFPPEYKLTFPPEYTAFLLNYNGGRPVSFTPTVEDNRVEVGSPVEGFDSLATVGASPDHPLRHWIEIPDHPKLGGCIPIGETNSGADTVYLNCLSSDRKFGRVLIWRDSQHGEADPDSVETLSRNLAELLARLKIKRFN